jgi:large subunit ribosomal protein L10
MAIDKNKKKKLITTYIDLINGSEAVIFVDTQHLNVKTVESFKKLLYQCDSKYILIKNTLFKRAFSQSNKKIPLMIENLSGYNACIFLKGNIIESLKLVTTFSQTNKLNINFGILDMYTMDSQEIIDLSTISSKEQLILNILFVLNSGISKLVYAINYHNQILVNLIKNISDAKGGE